MKKIKANRRESIVNAGLARRDRNIARLGRKYDPNRAPSVRIILGQMIIKAPENISIYDLDIKQADYIKTIDFLESLKKHIGSGKNCCIDFSSTERVTAAALVLVYATVETANKVHKKNIGFGSSKKSKRVNDTIRTSNLSKLLNAQGFEYSLDSSRRMPIVSSTGSNHLEEIIDYIQQRIYNDKMSPETEHAYGDAVSETINNVGLHAYPDSPNEEKRWWLTCSTFGKKLYLAIYDQGVGIPKTVVDRPWFFGRLSKIDPNLYAEMNNQFPSEIASGLTFWVPQRIPDEKLIYLSMQGDVTGTQKDKHGQGSKSIMALVSDTSDGILWVFSNNGVYTFNQEGQTPSLVKLNKKFPGTLIQWNIEIP